MPPRADYLHTISGSRRYRRFGPIGTRFLLWIFVIVLVLFGSYQMFFLLRGPVISFDDSIDLSNYNLTINNIIKLSGTTDRVAYLYINDFALPINTDDSFDFDLYMPQGTSTIDIRITDRYGRQKSEEILVHNPGKNLTTKERLALADRLRNDTATD